MDFEDMIKKAGLSKADSAKALSALKSGKINMGQLASKLNMSTLPTITDPHERLKAKLRQQQGDRKNKDAKETEYENMRERVNKEKEEREKAATSAVKKAAVRRKNHAKKLKELEIKYGTITDELYQRSMQQLTNTSLPEDEKNRLKNIIEIYSRQNQFKDTIDFGELDEI
jgi:protein subunit release factor A